jgi:DnaJ-domain-containing protein 1
MSGVEIGVALFGVLFGFVAIWHVLGLFTTSSRARGQEQGPEHRSREDSGGDASHESQPNDDDWKSVHWWEVLQIDPSSSWEAIRAAYKRRISTYHPDRFDHLGDDFRALAQERAKRINAAYSRAKSDRNQR